MTLGLRASNAVCSLVTEKLTEYSNKIAAIATAATVKGPKDKWKPENVNLDVHVKPTIPLLFSASSGKEGVTVIDLDDDFEKDSDNVEGLKVP